MKAPAPPAGLLKVTRDAWTTFWASPLAAAVTEPDVPVVRRLFTLRDEQERALRGVRASGQRAVSGSQGQPRLNPLLDHAARLEGQIVALEDRLGLSPMARARLGLKFGEAELTVAQVNAMSRKRAGDELVDDEWEEA